MPAPMTMASTERVSIGPSSIRARPAARRRRGELYPRPVGRRALNRGGQARGGPLPAWGARRRALRTAAALVLHLHLGPADGVGDGLGALGCRLFQHHLL